MSSNTATDLIARLRAEGRKPNRLIDEKSPYLLQHAFNPVDWYPWGDEPFEKARKENKPVFLSIGYSTCYWCHVMEREVFENEEIARLMNETLVCIKVDREERPDVDRIYMTVVQALTGSGGWPMSVFLTADRKPFFGGTYFPPADAYNRPGFPSVVRRIGELWQTERGKIIESSEEITTQLESYSRSPGPDGTIPLEATLEKGFHQFRQGFDDVNGGFGGAPKFPRPVAFNFLLRYYARTGDDAALRITLRTLHAMANGGMYDQIGGGFHRYSVDAEWRVPHFEKMLYDQAQLASSYLDAYQITHDPFHARMAREILGYVKRNLTDPDGGLYSAEDAESAYSRERPDEKEEGVFYVWSAAEIDAALPSEQAAIFKFCYGVQPNGNALHDPQHVFTGKNILYCAQTHESAAATFNRSVEQIIQILSEAREALFAVREKRPRPHLDDKIVTAWNGLAISAFARAAQVLDDGEARDYAERAARFVLTRLRDQKTGRLLRRYRDGDARFEGTLQDYAFFIQGLLDLYEASFRMEWLTTAIDLAKLQVNLFRNADGHGFNDTMNGTPGLIFTTREDYDSAEPTGNSVAALNLLRLARMTDNHEWQAIAEQTVGAFGARLDRMPEVVPQMLCAVEWMKSVPKEIIIAGTPEADDTLALLRAVHAFYVPNKVMHIVDDHSRELLRSFLPFVAGMQPIEGRAAAYICENYACNLPTTVAGNIGHLMARHPSTV